MAFYWMASNLPLLEDVFEDNRGLLKVLQEAGIKTVTPLMFLPERILIDDIPGLGKKRAGMIRTALKLRHLPQKELNESVPTFIARAFGELEDTPATALQVTHTRTLNCMRPRFNPLYTLIVLEDHDPTYTIDDLLMTPRHEFVREIKEHMNPTLTDAQIAADMREINHRLHFYNESFGVGARARGRLTLVQ